MRNFIGKFLSLEEESGQETEVTIYAKITNFDGLLEADHQEHQMQYEANLGDGGRSRVRKTSIGDQVKHVFTFKYDQGKNENGLYKRRERNLDVDQEFLDDFIEIAERLQDKTRYIFDASSIQLTFQEGEDTRVIDVPNVKYEVDVFKKIDGGISEWCKIDVEVDGIMSYLETNYPELKNLKLNIKVTHLPFKPESPFLSEDADEEQKKFRDDLYNNVFNQDLVEARKNKVDTNE